MNQVVVYLIVFTTIGFLEHLPYNQVVSIRLLARFPL